MDECSSGAHNCRRPNQRCINTDGSHRCQCEHGYTLNSKTEFCDGICCRFLLPASLVCRRRRRRRYVNAAERRTMSVENLISHFAAIEGKRRIVSLSQRLQCLRLEKHPTDKSDLFTAHSVMTVPRQASVPLRCLEVLPSRPSIV